MTETIDHISINDIFWIQFKSHLVSFGFKGLPDNIHFTIGFDDRSPDINFHVTKNSANSKDKPQIKIVVIDKHLLEEINPSLTLSILNKMLKPLDIEELKAKYNYDLGFISFDSLQNSEAFSLTEQRLIDSFKDISRFRRKTRLKVEGDIEKRLETFATSEVIQKSILDNIVELSDEFEKNVEGGMVLTEDNTLQVIRINERWFTIRPDIKPLDLLCAFVNPQLARHLIWKTKRALIAVKNAGKYSDMAHLNKPIRLEKQQQKKIDNSFRTNFNANFGVQTDMDKVAHAANMGFASSGLTRKLGALCFYQSLVPVESVVLLYPSERKAQNRYAPGRTFLNIINGCFFSNL